MVDSDPAAELPVRNRKYVKDCTEMYLANKNIGRIANFEAFVNIEVLWINDNQIERLEGLDQCFRIKQLYAHNNKISSLQGSSIRHFKFLQCLRLYGNQLSGLDEVLYILSHFHHLTDLDLFGNPIEAEENYRLKVIHAIPTLHAFDRHIITEDDRYEANRLFKRKHADQTKSNQQNPVKANEGGHDSLLVKQMFREAKAIQAEEDRKYQESLKPDLPMVPVAPLDTLPEPDRKNGLKYGPLDEWEIGTLRKQFRILEESGKGIQIERVPELVQYLNTRGFVLYCDDVRFQANEATPLETGQVNDKIQSIFDSEMVTWDAFTEALRTNRLRFDLMTRQELLQEVEFIFAKLKLVQPKLLEESGEELQKAVRESHLLSQQANRLQTLATSISDSNAQSESTACYASKGKYYLKRNYY